MSNEDILNKEVGNKERKALEAKDITILGTTIEEVLGKKGGKNEGKSVGQKVVLVCKHPDKEEPVNISQAKLIQGESVKTSTLWINLDEDKNIQKGSPVAVLLEKAGVKILKELETKIMPTDPDSSGYLCVKLY